MFQKTLIERQISENGFVGKHSKAITISPAKVIFEGNGLAHT